MADRLTQLQDAVDQLAQQFVASMWYVTKHHDYAKLGPTDRIIAGNKKDVDPKPADIFVEGQRELAQDLILKEQQIEFIISQLPGLDNSEKEQEQMIQQLEVELKAAEEERKEAVNEKEAILEKLEAVIRDVKRP